MDMTREECHGGEEGKETAVSQDLQLIIFFKVVHTNNKNGLSCVHTFVHTHITIFNNKKRRVQFESE